MDQRKSIILFVMSIVASFLLVQAVDANDGRIAGGEEATPGEFPWMVSVQTMGGYHYCGATLIAPEWVLTASHCIYGESAGQVKVVIGRHDLTTGEGQTVNVARIIMHPDYGITLDNDIALLKLASPVNDVAPIGLVTAGMGVDDVGKAATISGWGAWSSGGSPLDKLRKVTVPILSNTDCNSNYNVKIKMDMICTGLDEGGKNPCHGDNGGPMMVRNAADDGWLQAGVVSWGLGCTSADRPGVYARVTEFTGWIDAQINGVEPPPPATEETVEGEVTAISAESITLNISITARTAQTFVIDSNTSVDGSPEVGNKVRVRYDTTTNTAVRIRVLDDGGWQFESARGTVTAIDANGLTVDVETQTGIASEQFSIDENTWMLATPDVGDQVRVDYDPTTRFAYSVAVLGGGSGTGTSMRVRGVVTAIDATSISIETETATRVAVETYIIDDATHMRDMPEVGDNVRVRYNTETNVAIRIAVIHNGGGGSMYERVEGTVLDISDNSITIEAVESAYRTSEPLVTVYAIDGMTWMPEMVAVDDYVRIVADAESQTALSIHRMDGGEPPVNTYDRVRGKVTAISALSITIETSGVHHRDAAMTFTIDANTGIEGDPEVGDRVRIEYSTETMLALSIRVVGDDGGWPGWPGQDEYVEITGTVEAISDEAYTVDGVAYAISQDTYVEGDPAIGDVVYIFAEVNEDGTFTALYIAPYEDDLGGGEEYEFDWGGMVTAIDADSITVNNV
ncbi:MAG: trypsin-like serine protease, partial [Candidatus Promineifilaceae bacterium]